MKEIVQRLKRHRPILKQQFKVEKIGIFGSYTRSQATTKSDVDILVEFYEPIGWEFVDLQHYLENVLERPVDSVTPNALKPQLKEQILNSNGLHMSQRSPRIFVQDILEAINKIEPIYPRINLR